jgi:glucosyl-3-phosphoglycerate synthase
MKVLLMRLWRKLHHFLRIQSQFAVQSSKDILNRQEVTGRSSDPCPALCSVIIPALNEEKAIESVIQYAQKDAFTGEVIVIDDSSIDETAAISRAAGALVFTSSMLGKGASMQDGVKVASFEYIVFLDGDLSGLEDNIISKMIAPLIADEADFVKAKFGRGGGRVTELTAKPMLKVFFPELAGISQPLGGIIACRASLLKKLSFESTYGVDIGLLIDAHLKGARICEVDIGSLEHDSQPLVDLTTMANEVGRVIHHYSRHAGRLHVEQISEMYEEQRLASASFDYIINRRKDRRKVLLLDMDGTITPNRFIKDLAAFTHTEETLDALLDASQNDAATRSQQIAEIFKFTHRTQFEKVAMSMPIKPGVVEFINQMKRNGFMVGIVSDSYFIAAEIMRKRIFADFAIAHTLKFRNDICSGDLTLNKDFYTDQTLGNLQPCKSNVIKRFLSKKNKPSFLEIWAIGDNLNDLEMLLLADKAFVIDPKSPEMLKHKHIRSISTFEDLHQANAVI